MAIFYFTNMPKGEKGEQTKQKVAPSQAIGQVKGIDLRQAYIVLIEAYIQTQAQNHSLKTRTTTGEKDE